VLSSAFNCFIYYMQHIITFCTITKADFYVSDFIFLILLRCNWILLGKPEGTRLRGRPRRRWEYNIKKGLQEVEWRGTDWIDLAYDRYRKRALVNAVMNIRVP